MSKFEAGSRIRIRLITALFVLVFVVVIGRAFYLQVVSQEKWQELASRQYHKTIPVAAQRGTIFDRNGEELAVSLEVDSVYLEPKRIDKPAETGQLLAATLSLPYTQIKEKLTSTKGFLWLKRQITPEEGAKLRDELKSRKLEGVNFAKEHRRFYPNGPLGAQVLGFTGLDPGGLEGVELKYNRLLLGRGSSTLVSERDNLGRGIGSSRQQEKEGEVKEGEASHLYLTIDKKLQYIAEKELAEGVRSSGSKAGCVIVLEPSTGRILAMANYPVFNPNAVKQFSADDWRNRTLTDTYEPGSTSKVFLVAAGLNEKVIRPNDLIYCENGAYVVGGKRIRDHSAHGMLTITEVLKYSSNIGSAKIGKRLERERLYNYLRDFGLGAPTGIDLPGETTGVLRKPNRWYEIDLAAISFGQGLTVTPLQIASGISAIANHGLLMQPHIVDRIVHADGRIEEITPKPLRQVVSRETAHTVRDMLMTVTEKGGTGTLAVVPGYRTAGKTGTAQKADPKTGGYSVDKRVSSFVGFIPAEDPRLVILAVLDEPQGQVYGGLIAAPIFSRVAAQSLQVLGIPPTYPEDKGTILPSEETIAKLLKAYEAKPDEKNDEMPVEDLAPVVEVDENGELIAPIQSGPLMPDFAGLSSRQVLQLSSESRLNIRLIGSGRVVEQQPAAGMPIPYDSEIWVRLEPPSDRPPPPKAEKK